MRLAHIVPSSILNQVYDQGETLYLCVTSMLLMDPHYRTFYQQMSRRGDDIILDTDAFETEHVPDVTEVIQCGQWVEPTYIVIPDVRRDMQATIDYATEFSDQLRTEFPNSRLIGVAQGRTWSEYERCIHVLDGITTIDVIGVVEEFEEFGFANREQLVRHVASRTEKPLHLNGVSETCSELFSSIVRGRAPTADTSKFVVWGLNGEYCTPQHVPATYPGRASVGGRVGFFGYNTTEPYVTQVRSNIKAWRDYLCAP